MNDAQAVEMLEDTMRRLREAIRIGRANARSMRSEAQTLLARAEEQEAHASTLERELDRIQAAKPANPTPAERLGAPEFPEHLGAS